MSMLPKPSQKPPENAPIEDRNGLETVIRWLSWIKARAKQLRIETDQAKDELEKGFTQSCVVSGESFPTLTARLLKSAQAFITENRDELIPKGKKSAQISTCKTGFKASQPKLVPSEGQDPKEWLKSLITDTDLQAGVMDAMNRLIVWFDKDNKPQIGTRQAYKAELVADNVNEETAMFRADTLFDAPVRLSATAAKAALKKGQLSTDQLNAIGLELTESEDTFFLNTL